MLRSAQQADDLEVGVGMIGAPAGVKGLVREACDFLEKLKLKQQQTTSESEGWLLAVACVAVQFCCGRCCGRAETVVGR